MAFRFTQRLQWLRDAPGMPEEVRLALLAPLYRRVASLALGHCTGLLLGVFAVLRIHGAWPVLFLLILVVSLAARMALLARARQHGAPGRAAALLRLAPAYFAVGSVWAIASGVFCALCVLGHDDSLGMFAPVLAMGTSAGIATRNAGTPRFAIIQLGGLLLPIACVGIWLGSDYWVLTAFFLLYLVALCSIVRQTYGDLTALLGAERDNRVLAARFEAAISTMTQGLLLFDSDSRLQVVNRRFRELFALPSDQPPGDATLADVGRLCSTRGVPDAWARTPPAASARAECDLATGRSIAIAHEMRADGGRLITFEDITEHRHAALALAEREAELAAIFANAAAGVAETDAASGGFTRVNPEFCRLVGCTEATLLAGLTLTDVTHPQDRPDSRRRLRTLLETGAVETAEQRYVRPDSSEIWVRVSSSRAQVAADGRALRLVSVVHDITERVAAAAALRASEDLLRMSMAVGQVGSYRRDYVTGLVDCGRETRAMLGLPDGDAPIPEAEWLAVVVPEDRDRITAEIQAAYAPGDVDMAVEYRLSHPADGGIRHIEVRMRTAYGADRRPILSTGVLIDVTERRLSQARIDHLAHHDPLTDLANRTLFRGRLDAAVAAARAGAPFALCCIDLDRFKQVNDSLGHPVGDALLRAVAGRLRATVRQGDTVARLGGDEFAVIQLSPRQPEDGLLLARRLLARLSAPYELDGHMLEIGASIGVAIGNGISPDVLFKNADEALYRAKQDGRGRVHLHEPATDAAAGLPALGAARAPRSPAPHPVHSRLTNT